MIITKASFLNFSSKPFDVAQRVFDFIRTDLFSS